MLNSVITESKNKYGLHVAIFETKQKINGHTCCPPPPSILSAQRNPVGVVRVTAPSVFISKMTTGPPFWITSKNLFDVHNPQTIPDLGVKFQTIWPIHFWEIAVHGSTCGRTYGQRSNYQPPPFGLGAKKHLHLERSITFQCGIKCCSTG